MPPVQRSRLERFLHTNLFKLSLIFVVTGLVYVYYEFPQSNLFQDNPQSFTDVADRAESLIDSSAGGRNARVEHIDRELSSQITVLMSFVNAADNKKLVDQFKLCISSMIYHSSVDIHFNILADPASKVIAKQIISDAPPSPKYSKPREHKVLTHDIEKLGSQYAAHLQHFQEKFSHSAGAQFSHALFFLPIFIHRVLPLSTHRLVLLDADLKFRTDIAMLYGLFKEFGSGAALGLGPELQPVYRHLLWKYRNTHKGTLVGDPLPRGSPGFNSGVALMDLARLRRSTLYNGYLEASNLSSLTAKYSFKGHLGDQDFYSLLHFEHPELFYVLPCTWNRQLCTWWKNNGYEDVHDQYFACSGYINIYHGNCGTPIPED